MKVPASTGSDGIRRTRAFLLKEIADLSVKEGSNSSGFKSKFLIRLKRGWLIS